MSKTLKHDIKSNAILNIGMEVIWSKGYNATSVNDIVKAAGIPKGSFYFYFDSKEDFVLKSLDKYFESHFYPAIEVLQDKNFSPRERLLNFYEFRAKALKEELNCKKGCLCCNMANEMAEHNEEIRKSVASKSNLIKSHIVKVMVEAQEEGEISKTVDVEKLTGFIEDSGKGAMITMKEMNSAEPIENMLDIIRTLLLQ
ncbi:TetR/AcrR family transcriptional regulator [uncultured Maribacter sp.]|uniref:TetR/AcrR family transcriptional regulator n=1 Tax=uncultured Maribacter sp. TaxID=431308 RepID=UPI00260B0EB5|nr:TetR/AcrR family transcriptional regulator [uncultured Maribacter sp.]